MRDSIPSWQKILAQGYSTAEELLDFLQLPLSLGCTVSEKQFKTRVPRNFAALMEPGNPNDPLLLQVLSTPEEQEKIEDFVADPLSESVANPLPGLLHKYNSRVLLTLSGSCAINCRYCFRRHFPYRQNNPGKAGWGEVIDYIKNDFTIQEVILSGGDPLLVKDNLLFDLVTELEKIPHLRILRIHTRIPVVLPERIDEQFIQHFSKVSLQKVIVLHSNHPRELDSRVQEACIKLRSMGCHLLNQSVLLKKINNDVSILRELSERLFSFGVLPYYLHVVDKVQGAAHFDVPLDEAISLFKELQTLLPGYLVPRLVREESGKKNKTLLASC